MAERYLKQMNPFVVPGTGIKTIEEHFGLASTGESGVSIAHMIAPPGWSEPAQTPEFDEYVMVVRGRKLVEIGGERIELRSGESIRVPRNTRVRYSNPFAEETEYWSVCIPAFNVQAAHREA